MGWFKRGGGLIGVIRRCIIAELLRSNAVLWMSRDGRTSVRPYESHLHKFISIQSLVSDQNPHAFNPVSPTHWYFVLSTVSLASRDRRTQRSTSTISRKNRGL